MSKKTPVANKQSNNLFKYFSPSSKKPVGENDSVAKSLKDSFSPSPKKVKVDESLNVSSKELKTSPQKEKKRQIETDSDHSEKENDEIVEGKRPRKKVGDSLNVL